VVGRTGFCVHPREAVRAVPKVGGTKTVDIDAVLALRPTHLVVNIDENEKPSVDRLARDIPEVVVTHPLRIDDNLPLYRQFGEVFNRVSQADALSLRLRESLDRVRAKPRTERSVIYLIWKDPWMTVSHDTYISDALAQVGLRVLAPASPRRYPEIDWSAWPASQADLVLFSSEPYRFSEQHARDFAQTHGLDERRCLCIDGEMTSWYGPRAIEGLDYLARLRDAIDERLA
jgi:ABC-type Fe3+-hydroxamate transport system substrate-binding protein